MIAFSNIYRHTFLCVTFIFITFEIYYSLLVIINISKYTLLLVLSSENSRNNICVSETEIKKNKFQMTQIL